MSNYAKADTKTQWFQDDYPGAPMNLSEATAVLVLHTTETTGWPGYDGGKTAPTYTGKPPLGDGQGGWRAHFPDERSARALENDRGGVETNTLNVIQIELVGTCDPKHVSSWNGEGKLLRGRDYVFWPYASPRQLDWLADIIADLHRRHGLRLHAPRFVGYPKSYGPDNGVRFTAEQWRKFAGICGHQHVPENVHGDPGNIPIDSLIRDAEALIDDVQEAPVKVRNAAQFVAAVANIRHDMTASQKMHDFGVVRRIGAGITAFCEVDNAESRGLLHAAFQDRQVVGTGWESPVAFGPSWTVQAVKIRKRTDGVDGITPDRKSTVVQAVSPSGVKVLVMVDHPVSEREKAGRTQQLRQSIWRRWARQVRGGIQWWRVRGWNVVHLGDLNTHAGPVQLGKGQVTHVVELMQITALPAVGWRVKVTNREAVRDVRTDHPVAVAGIRFER